METPGEARSATKNSATTEPGLNPAVMDQVHLMRDQTRRLQMQYRESVVTENGLLVSSGRAISRGFIVSKSGWCALPLPIFLPGSTWLRGWDLMCLAFILFETFALPFWLGFDVQPSGWSFDLVSIVNLYFILDVPLNFLRATQSSTGQMVVSTTLIAKQYIKWLPFDAVAAIPWEWIHTGSLMQFTKLLRFSRIVRLIRLTRLEILPLRIALLIESNSWLNFVSGIIRVIFLLFGITHWSACLWFYVGNHSSAETTWISAHMPAGAGFWTRYVYSWYFTLTTMTTVGYGDITPQNEDEVCFTSVLLLVATVVFATLMGSLTDLICSLQSEKHARDARIRNLSHYMHWRDVPTDLFKAIRKHMVYLWETNRDYDAYENDVKDHLPPVLRRELCYHIHGHALRSLPFLAWIWDFDVCLKDLANALYSVILTQGDHIFRCGKPNMDIYALRAGSVRVSLNEHLFNSLDDFEDQTDKAKSMHDNFHKMIMQMEVLSTFPQPQKNSRLFEVTVQAAKAQEAHSADAASLLFQPRALRDAVEFMEVRDSRQRWAARYIQRHWQRRKLREDTKQDDFGTTTESRTIEAPAYLGESCLWVPFEQWDAEDTPVYSYSARCATISELLVIPRKTVQELINTYSPWLKQRFDDFREDVVAGLEKQAQEKRRLKRVKYNGQQQDQGAQEGFPVEGTQSEGLSANEYGEDNAGPPESAGQPKGLGVQPGGQGWKSSLQVPLLRPGQEKP